MNIIVILFVGLGVEAVKGEALAASGRAALLADRLASACATIKAGNDGHWIPDDLLLAEPAMTARLLAPYLGEASPRVRWFAHSLLYRAGIRTEDVELRRLVTYRLVEALRDSDPLVWQAAGEWLLAFEEGDFSADARRLLHELLANPDRPIEVLWVVGVAGMREEAAALGALIVPDEAEGVSDGTQQNLTWVARIVRARLGVRDEVEHCIKLTEADTDPVYRVCRRLKHLAFTRQPAALAYVAQYLGSENRLPRSNKGTEGERVRDRIMVILYASSAEFVGEVGLG